MARDHYIVLGIPRGASTQQIKTAYRRGAKRLHPDVCGNLHPDAFRELTDAYETLSDEKKRRAYDAALGREPSPSSGPMPGRRTRMAPAADPCPIVPLDDAPAFRGSVPTLDLEVHLPADLARAGGRIVLQLPFATACPWCAGAFRGWFGCPLCGGSGTVETAIEVPLDIAPGTTDGDHRTVALHRQGLMLRIRFVRS